MEQNPVEQAVLLKCDVDGFDDEVILSGKNFINRHQPLIYFEADARDLAAINRFKSLLKWLNKTGYKDITMFDNFGTKILRTNELWGVFELLDYVHQQNQGAATRSIYYFDFLAGTSSHKNLIDAALSAY